MNNRDIATSYKELEPMNISLLVLNDEIISKLGKVTTRDVFEQNSTEFNKNGLFSTTIFGPVGSRERLERMGYIEFGLKVLHPRIYKELVTLSSFYKEILEGKKYAIFNDKTNDFEPADQIDGKTGYSFFMEYYDKLKIRETDSLRRKFSILFIKKYRASEVFIDKYLVIPAGIRDYIITSSGKALENEINNYYRKLLSVARAAEHFKTAYNDTNNEFINSLKVRIQKIINDIYDYIENLLDGKSKMIRGKWVKRAIFYGTRNVITADPSKIYDLTDGNRPKPFDVKLGVFQAAKGILPVTIFQLKTKFLYDIFSPTSESAYLIDKESLTRKYIRLNEKQRKQWVTDDGIENTINRFIQEDVLKSAIEINNHYLLLVYDDGKEIRVLSDINELPLNKDKKYVRPITYLELIYLTLFDIIGNYPAYLTRYPVTNIGSTNIVTLYLKSTVEGRKVDIYLRKSLEAKVAPEYPLLDKEIYTSLAVPHFMLDPMGGDFDGDKTSLNIVWKKESIDEMMNKLHSKELFIKPDGKLLYSGENLINKILLKELTE